MNQDHGVSCNCQFITNTFLGDDMLIPTFDSNGCPLHMFGGLLDQQGREDEDENVLGK
jgi:hypothetical protein